MMATKGTLGVIAIAALCTGGLYAERSRVKPLSQEMVVVSDLKIGDPLPGVVVRAIGPSSSWHGCRILVVYTPACKHCRAAAARDRELPVDSLLPAVWMTYGESGGDSMATFLPASVVNVHSERGVEALKIRAFPAAFVIGADDRIRLILPHSGGTPRSRYRSFCGAPVSR